MTKYLKQASSGHIYIETEALKLREDMSPCDAPHEVETLTGIKPMDKSIISQGPYPTREEIEFSVMHWRELKRMVEDKGGIWTNKKAALEFLETL